MTSDRTDLHVGSYWQGWRHGATVACIITSLVWWVLDSLPWWFA